MNLTQDHQFFRDQIARFSDDRIRPAAAEIDAQDEFPRVLFQELGKLGYFGIRYPDESGTANPDAVMFSIYAEEVARGSLALAASCMMQSLMGTDFLYRFGTPEIKERLFKPAMRGEKLGVIAFTEPNCGSDLAATETTAKEDGKGFVLNGAKMWITNAPFADFFTVVATTDRGLGLKGLNFFLVEKGTEGFSVGRKLEKMGAHGSWASEIVFEECRIPRDHLLGERINKGVVYLGQILGEIRIMMASLALGLSRAALEEAVRYARERRAFGRAIGKYQLIQEKIARMATELEASRWLLYRACSLKDKGLEYAREAMMAKVHASEAALMCVDEARRIHGAYGYSREYPIERLFRDAGFLLYGGGSHEILTLNIAREIMGKF
ncbi:MAG: acyl-CoA dehydrogenase family protein [Deltaproteobacteria bacterium]|nr:acyl-CoA dehydrogenase family protein [Deltaproteobacteria bacterium]